MIVVGVTGPDVTPNTFPAGLEHVVAVTESETPCANQRLVRAPERDLVTLRQGHYDFASGSSLATTEVTGVIALLLERSRKLAVSEACGSYKP